MTKSQRENDNKMLMSEESGKGYVAILYSVIAAKI